MVPLLRLMHAGIRVRRRALVRTLAGVAPRAAAAGRGGLGLPELQRRPARRARRGASRACRSSSCSPTSPTSRRASGSSPGIDRVVVGTDEAREQALALGIPRRAGLARLGHGPAPALLPRRAGRGAARVRAELGIAAGDSRSRCSSAARARPRWRRSPSAAREDPALRVIAICGDNPRPLRAAGPARGPGGRAPRVRSASRTEWPSSWPASDLLVTKPGPGSLAEAFHQRVPVVVTRNVHTIPQERFNTDFVARPRARPRRLALARDPRRGPGPLRATPAARARCASGSRRCPRTAPSTR